MTQKEFSQTMDSITRKILEEGEKYHSKETLQAARGVRKYMAEIGYLRREVRRQKKRAQELQETVDQEQTERENLLESVERLRWEKQAAQNEIVAMWERGSAK